MKKGDHVEMLTDDEGLVEVGARGIVIDLSGTFGDWAKMDWGDGARVKPWIPIWKLKTVSPLILLAEQADDA